MTEGMEVLSAGAPGVTEPRFRNKNGRNLNFFTGVSEFRSWARDTLVLHRIPASGTGKFFGSFREFLRSFGEL